jgi:hypothetical protein
VYDHKETTDTETIKRFTISLKQVLGVFLVV